MTHAQNPLLDFTDLPRFDLIQPEHVKPAIESLLADGRALIERLTADSTPATWTDFAGALSDGLEASAAPGASSATCTRSTTCRPGARPTTRCCRRSRVSTPNSART
jgi:Zn-dependent oligopeptidase